MATQPPVIISSGGSDPPLRRAAPPHKLWAVALMAVLAVVVQVSLMPYIRVAEGIPDVVAATVACTGLLRGRLVGAVTGFGAGLLVELTSPVGTLGVMALLYLVAGWFCGRYCERPESHGVLPALVLAVGTAGFMQLGYAAVQMLLGESIFPADFTARLLVPSLALTALILPPVLLLMRRLLGEPRVYEPAPL